MLQIKMTKHVRLYYSTNSGLNTMTVVSVVFGVGIIIKLIVSHQGLSQNCMRAGGTLPLCHYLIILVHSRKCVM